MRNGVDEMDNALLPRDTSNEQQEGPVRVDAIFNKHVSAGRGLVLVWVDAIMDNVDPLGCDIEQSQNVRLGFARDGDNGVGLLDGGAFHPSA